MILKIVQTGEPVLRQRARPLSAAEIKSPSMRQLVAMMRETMRDAPGVGLAAPQIGEALQMAVIEDRPQYTADVPQPWLDERGRKPVPFHVLYNPRLTLLGDEQAEYYEGCLSVDGYAALVPRAKRVRVEALDENALPVTIEAEGWYARILQHEIDHLHGHLYIDRMHTRTFTTSENQGRYYAGMKAAEIHSRLEAALDEEADDEADDEADE